MGTVRTERKEIDKEMLFFDVLAAVFILVAIVTLVILTWSLLDSRETVYEVTVYRLTEEEMKQRPLMPKEEEPIENVNVAVGEPLTEYTPTYKVIPLPDDLQIFAQEKCKEYEVSFTFFLAMLESESSFNKEAKGDSGNSVGYMQINKVNWDRYGLNAFMPQDNIEIGIRMMSEYIKAYDDIDMVIMCYKAGEHRANELRDQNIRLSACDTVLEAMAWWEEALNRAERITGALR